MQPYHSTIQLPLEYPAAVFPARLEWLCQPEQIEHTLRLLYYLNFWKKAQDRLTYPDRLGLDKAQALVLEYAARTGMIQMRAYLDRSHRFPGELLLESAAENAARGVLIHLNGLTDPYIWPAFENEEDSTYQRFIRPLCRRMSGRNFQEPTEAREALRLESLRAYIQTHLERLIAKARATRQPLSSLRLAALCIAPADLLPVRANCVDFYERYENWDDLDISHRRKLDPEGYSQIVLHYSSPSAEFVFHLPFRQAEAILPSPRLRLLPRPPEDSQELARLQGKAISATQGQHHPARELLQDLGLDIGLLCPHNLQEKEEYLTSPALRDLIWPLGSCEDVWEDDPWEGPCGPSELQENHQQSIYP